MGQLVSHQEARFYDVAVPDWPGEIDFYRALAEEVKRQGGAILEVGCGTGRVSLRLAQEGARVTGLDLSPDMLAVARQSSQNVPGVRWVEADMQSFELAECFDLVLIPGHSFQFMLTAAQQLACLSTIRRHLKSGGRLVVHIDHQDPAWLGGLSQGQGTGLKLAREYRNGSDGIIRQWNAWWYERNTQTASVVTVWEVLGESGAVRERYESPIKHCHCVFRVEMEHALARAGFVVEALYGDFYRHELGDTSQDMIWLARPAEPLAPKSQ